MSQINTIATSVGDVNQMLTKLGSSIKLNAEQKALHTEFFTIWNGGHNLEDRAWLWDCAEQACIRIQNQFKGFRLSQYGVSRGVLQGYYREAHTIDKIQEIQTQFIDEQTRANIAFLEAWKEIRNTRLRNRAELAVIAEKVRQVINSKDFILAEMTQIIEELKEKGFYNITLEKEFQRDNVDILSNGITLQFNNEKGELREVTLYGQNGGNCRVHVEMADHNLCRESVDKFALWVRDMMQTTAQISGLPVSATPGFGQSTESGIGNQVINGVCGENLENIYSPQPTSSKI